jgi:hypothetical protein
MAVWPYGFGPVVRQSLMVEHMIEEASQLVAAGKCKREEGARVPNNSFQGHTPITSLPSTRPQPLKVPAPLSSTTGC